MVLIAQIPTIQGILGKLGLEIFVIVEEQYLDREESKTAIFN